MDNPYETIRRAGWVKEVFAHTAVIMWWPGSYARHTQLEPESESLYPHVHNLVMKISPPNIGYRVWSATIGVLFIGIIGVNVA